MFKIYCGVCKKRNADEFYMAITVESVPTSALARVLTRILKMGVKMLSSRKSWEFYYMFLLRRCKKLE